MVNPFVYERPLPPEELIDREAELETLADLAAGGHSTRLVAPRRYGKTTLVGALEQNLRKQGWLVLYVDFSNVTTLADVANRLGEAWVRAAEHHRAARRPGKEIRRRLGIEVGIPGIAKARVDPPAERPDPFTAIHDLLELPAKVGDSRTLVIFDEFQDLLTAGKLDGVVRSHAQHHLGKASYCYVGSQMSMMAALFEDRRRPLFAQARRIGLAPLEREDLIEWIRARDPKLDEGIAAELAGRAAGHPQRAMMLAHFLWEQPRRTSDDLEAARAAAVQEASGEIQQIWASLPATQRLVLRAAAEGHRRLLSKRALAFMGTEKSSAQKARDALLRDGHLHQTPQGHVPTDPFIAFWLRAG